MLKSGASIASLAAVASLLASCGSGSSNDDIAPADPGPGKYEQTWSRSYSETTCDDWLQAMDAHEKFVAAADMLTSARNKIDGGEGLPSDAMVSEFQGGISNVCVEPTMTLTDAAVGLYMTEPRFHP